MCLMVRSKYVMNNVAMAMMLIDVDRMPAICHKT